MSAFAAAVSLSLSLQGNLDKALNVTKIDDGIGVMFPYWDEGTHMVYVVGKVCCLCAAVASLPVTTLPPHLQGDQKCVYFEITEGSPYVFFLNMYQSVQPVRGAACMPKKHLDFMHCEVMRFYNLITKGLIEPVSMTVPRKVEHALFCFSLFYLLSICLLCLCFQSDMFQEDIFPPCPSGESALSAEEWASGQDKDPKLLAFTAGGLEETSKGPKVECAGVGVHICVCTCSV